MINYDYGRLTGEIITREDFEYEEERKAWNRAIEKYPLIIVYCKTEDDIKNAIIFAKANSLSIRIRNGRHHYEGYSNGNDVVVIDVSKMNKIYMDEENERVKVIDPKQCYKRKVDYPRHLMKGLEGIDCLEIFLSGIYSIDKKTAQEWNKKIDQYFKKIRI